ncbi:aminotransferase class I/II-fold pyridoxal phosphate-dependent enzyme [Arthrobacter sp. JCM 19049]|uniref:aminotransferase class I/II-fold pyridoxal phosphate-dependent enzyme n=1 Tax=Arthrobacter sp. JCM 19049 TaxID=1460643 RepID=UPI000ADFD0E6|nr:aminotransferase class I/II-fold pyridoxal phosphate-dependent enzyme [Arthrobacter sp. JCM 19049]
MATESLLTAVPTRLASRASQLKGSVIDSSTSLLASQTHDIVRFAMGAPNAELIPEAELAGLYTRPAEGRYDYAATEGNPQLIEQIVAYHQRLGQPVDPARVLVTTGGMQGLDIAFKLLVDPGDLVIVESRPTPTGSPPCSATRARFWRPRWMTRGWWWSGCPSWWPPPARRPRRST